MKTKMLVLIIALFIVNNSANAQWVTFDPTNLAQGIVNSAKQIVETSTTAKNMISNFQETVKIYQQSKAYYDALKSVSNLVKDARKVQQTILMVGEISDIYVNNFQKMMSDPNFTVEELGAIANGYAILLSESANSLTEMKEVVTANGLSMNDKERIDVIDRVHSKVFRYRNLTKYYTNKNIGISFMRAKKKKDTDRILALYGNSNDRYW